MQTFSYRSVSTVEEALAALASPTARALGGGTDLIPMVREGRRQADLVVDVKGIPELGRLEIDAQGNLTIGAAVALHRVYGHPEVARRWPGLVDAASLIGGTAVQGRATLGGNLCTASPAGDSIPALIVHGATLIVAGPAGRRSIPVAAFCIGPGRTVLGPGELLIAIQVPAPRPRSGAAYLRFIPRNEMDIAVASSGVALQLDAEGHIAAIDVALGAVGPTPIVVADAAALALGQAPSAEMAAKLGAAATAAARPIDDVRGTAAHRKRLVDVLTRRAFMAALHRIG
ncbi:MAG: xanthine dehydrogenase family protein subunit M [Thermoflexales bacterium]|nr:xanthine dehydrogenase family protein subunit M [Thermoflexales bacterium]